MSRLLTFVFVIACIHLAWKQFGGSATRPSVSQAAMSTEQVRALAKTVGAEDVVIYTTPTCPYCNRAKSWLNTYGFAFTDCDMSIEPRCESEFRSYGADGTPYLLVHRDGRTHHMKDGFDSDEFLAALQ